MFNNGPIIVSAIGAARMQYVSDFDKEMEAKGFISPFKVQQRMARDLFKRTEVEINGKKVTKTVRAAEDPDPERYTDGKTALPVDEWIKMKDEYIARRVFEKFGWDAIQGDIKHNHLEHLLDELKPCEGPDGQCVLFCHFFPCTDKEN